MRSGKHRRRLRRAHEVGVARDVHLAPGARVLCGLWHPQQPASVRQNVVHRWDSASAAAGIEALLLPRKERAIGAVLLEGSQRREQAVVARDDVRCAQPAYLVELCVGRDARVVVKPNPRRTFLVDVRPRGEAEKAGGLERRRVQEQIATDVVAASQEVLHAAERQEVVLHQIEARTVVIDQRRVALRELPAGVLRVAANHEVPPPDVPLLVDPRVWRGGAKRREVGRSVPAVHRAVVMCFLD